MGLKKNDGVKRFGDRRTVEWVVWVDGRMGGAVFFNYFKRKR
jgi:hypothetical protein